MNEINEALEFELIEELLTVNTSSAWHFEQEQADQAKREWDYQRTYAQAFRQLQEAEMRVDVITAQIVDELLREAAALGSPIPPSARSELRRSKVPLDPRWQEAKQKWIEANERSNIMSGAINALRSKGYRLNSIQKMVERQLYNTTESGQTPARPTTRNVENRMESSGSNLI